MDSASLATLTNYLPGDILFYARADNDVFSTVISDWTGSPLVHVGIATSALMQTQALLYGVVSSPINNRLVAVSWPLHARAQVYPDLLAKALIWLESQVGHEYGWGDIFNAALSRFMHGMAVNVADHYDCSGLACEFLQLTGAVPRLDGIDPHTVTPAMLAQVLGVSNDKV